CFSGEADGKTRYVVYSLGQSDTLARRGTGYVRSDPTTGIHRRARKPFRRCYHLSDRAVQKTETVGVQQSDAESGIRRIRLYDSSRRAGRPRYGRGYQAVMWLRKRADFFGCLRADALGVFAEA